MMTNFVFDLINQFGYMAISFLIAIENVFPPIPSEAVWPSPHFLLPAFY